MEIIPYSETFRTYEFMSGTTSCLYIPSIISEHWLLLLVVEKFSLGTFQNKLQTSKRSIISLNIGAGIMRNPVLCAEFVRDTV